MSYFRAENLSLHFGGLKAVDSVSSSKTLRVAPVMLGARVLENK